jgi:hypothetical protein
MRPRRDLQYRLPRFEGRRIDWKRMDGDQHLGERFGPRRRVTRLERKATWDSRHQQSRMACDVARRIGAKKSRRGDPKVLELDEGRSLAFDRWRARREREVVCVPAGGNPLLLAADHAGQCVDL